MAFVPAPVTQLASTSTAPPNVQGLLGTSDYAKSAAPKMKYVPKKYVPKVKAEPAETKVKLEDAEAGPSVPRQRKELVMEATGAMALGPAARSNVPGFGDGSGGGGGGSGSGGGGGGGYASRARMGPTENIDNASGSENEDEDNKGHFDYHDDSDDYGVSTATSRKPNRQLQDIWRESDMAPIVVPSEGAPPRRYRRLADDTREYSPAMKPDPHDTEMATDAALKGVAPAVPMERSLADKERATLMGVGEYLLEHSSTREPLMNILQFPREFPDFHRRGDAAPSSNGLFGHDEDVKPDIKPSLNGSKPDGLPASAAENYLATGWEGWGKRATRKGRPPMGGTSGASGPIGKVQIMDSGKVRLVMGSEEGGNLLVYDVLPGSIPQFQQYLASITTPDTAHLNSASGVKPEPMDIDGNDEPDIKPVVEDPSCVLLGPVHRKFIARPDIDRLLADMAKLRSQEQEQERLKAVKAEEAIENWEEFDATAGSSRKPSAGKRSIKPKAAKAKA